MLVEKVSKNTAHILVLALLTQRLRLIFSDGLRLHEATIDLRVEDNAYSMPEPDAVVLRRSFRELRRRPQPEDILLVAEVSDSTLDFDLVTKARLYARAGIRDYWVFDVRERGVIVHRDPAVDGYASVVSYGADEQVSPLAEPQAAIRAGELV